MLENDIIRISSQNRDYLKVILKFCIDTFANLSVGKVLDLCYA